MFSKRTTPAADRNLNLNTHIQYILAFWLCRFDVAGFRYVVMREDVSQV